MSDRLAICAAISVMMMAASLLFGTPRADQPFGGGGYSAAPIEAGTLAPSRSLVTWLLDQLF